MWSIGTGDGSVRFIDKEKMSGNKKGKKRTVMYASSLLYALFYETVSYYSSPSKDSEYSISP